MWWALAREEEEMERAHNTESETWHQCMHGGREYAGCVWEVVMARHDTMCEGLDRARATDMWWALARAEEEMERAHNTERKRGMSMACRCVWEVAMARHDTTV